MPRSTKVCRNGAWQKRQCAADEILLVWSGVSSAVSNSIVSIILKSSAPYARGKMGLPRLPIDLPISRLFSLLQRYLQFAQRCHRPHEFGGELADGLDQHASPIQSITNIVQPGLLKLPKVLTLHLQHATTEHPIVTGKQLFQSPSKFALAAR